MPANIIDGKSIAKKVKNEISLKTSQLRQKGIIPGLAVVIVGNDPASRVYVNSKKKACDEVGFYSEEYALPETISQIELVNLVKVLNDKPDINGILVQLPLPAHIDEQQIIHTINPLKDVDAFHPFNVGKIMIGNPDFLPCTPAGVMELIYSTGMSIEGKHCVVVGRSNIVGKPMSMLLLSKNGTVTICHSKTKNIKEICKSADILVSAVGRPCMITADMVKEGAVVIDVGINRLEDGRLCGDVDFDAVSRKASYITPVPGGVGPMTIAMLMKNTLKACELQKKGW